MLNEILRYYRNFWNVYRLELKAREAPIVATTSLKSEVGNTPFSLIIIESGDESQTKAFFQALKLQGCQPNEVIILRRNPGNALSEISYPLTILEMPNISDSASRNRGIQAATYPIVVITETSVRPQDGWLENLLAPLNRDPALAFCIGKIVASNYAGQLLSDLYASVALSAGVSPLVCMTSLALRKIWWARVGGYPEDIPSFASAAIFAERIKAQDVTYSYTPARVTWMHGSSLLNTTKRIFQLADETGQIGLYAPIIWKQIQFVIITFFLALIVLALALTSPITGFLSFAIGLLLLSGWTLLWGYTILRAIGTKRNLIGGWLAAWLVGWYFLGYSWGVRKREAALENLNGQNRRHLQEIITAHPGHKGIVVYFPTHDWGNMFQRPHQMARQFARAGYLFFYGTRNEMMDHVAEFQPVEPNLFLVSMPAIPPEIFRAVQPLILYIGATWHAPMLDVYEQARTIYDHYDDLQVSGGQVEDHNQLLAKASVVLVSSQSLMEVVRLVRPDALLIPNAVDNEWIQQFEPKSGDLPPKDLAPLLQTGSPVIGYSGALAKWFDYSLLEKVARLRPNFEFVLLGINYDNTFDESGILNLPNVHWLGQKPYTQLFHYVWRFHVAMIPFQINRITLATSPIKLFEYFYCRKPVVSTPLPEVVRYNQVLVAETPEAFVAQIEKALEFSMSTEYQDTIQNIARANTWEGRARQVIARLNEIHIENGDRS